MGEAVLLLFPDPGWEKLFTKTNGRNLNDRSERQDCELDGKRHPVAKKHIEGNQNILVCSHDDQGCPSALLQEPGCMFVLRNELGNIKNSIGSPYSAAHE